MGNLNFRFIGWRGVTPEQWLRQWSALYGAMAGYDDEEYCELIRAQGALSGAHFERIGRWKDSAETDARWKPNIASVAYDIWMKAASEMPKCPPENRVEEFLNYWSERTYRDEYKSGKVRVKRFGLSRATTLLHFISGGRFPIFDSRVVAAVSLLLGTPAEYTVRWYVDSYRRVFSEIANASGSVDNVRAVDKALFCYGAMRLPKTGWPV
jgi:hypothetical protein